MPPLHAIVGFRMSWASLNCLRMLLSPWMLISDASINQSRTSPQTLKSITPHETPYLTRFDLANYVNDNPVAARDVAKPIAGDVGEWRPSQASCGEIAK